MTPLAAGLSAFLLVCAALVAGAPGSIFLAGCCILTLGWWHVRMSTTWPLWLGFLVTAAGFAVEVWGVTLLLQGGWL